MGILLPQKLESLLCSSQWQTNGTSHPEGAGCASCG
jgi:hypothetical protein